MFCYKFGFTAVRPDRQEGRKETWGREERKETGCMEDFFYKCGFTVTEIPGSYGNTMLTNA
jgi:hypothetical protein